MKKMITGKKLAWLFAFVYFASYTTRINLAAVIGEVVIDTGFEKSQLSVILVCLFISYGIGQVINGWIGDHIKPQNLIFIGLITATAVNSVFPLFASSIPVMCVLWTINGFAQAMMWPPIVKIMVSTMDEVTYSSASVIVSLGSSFGTVGVYLTAPLIIKLLSWQFVFVTSALIGLTSVIIWAFVKNRIYDPKTIDLNIPQPGEDKKFAFPKAAIFPLIFILLAIVLQGMLRDGVSSWMPTLLIEDFGMKSEDSILCTVSLAIFSILAFILAGQFYKKLFKNEVACAVAVWGFASLAALLLAILMSAKAIDPESVTGIIATIINSKIFTTIMSYSAIPAILFMTLINGAIHGINLMLIGHVPKRFRKYGNISTISGIVNAFTYVGSAIATYGIAKLAEMHGWQFTTFVWFAMAVLGLVCCLIAMFKWKKFIEK